MPLLYSTSPPTTRAQPSAVVQPASPQDVDDDIVLSNLVRGTGEASRLRRRGALRGVVGGRPSRWEVFIPYGDNEDDQPLAPSQTQPQQQPQQPQPQLSLPFPVAPPLDLDRDEQDEYTYVLRCGGNDQSNQPHDTDYDFDSDLLCRPSPSSSAFVPSMLPLYPPRPKSSSSHPSYSSHLPLKQKRSSGSKPSIAAPHSNGCGAIIHAKAAPRPKLGMWTAKTKASDSVVHLDSCYFDSAAVGRMVRSSCGCVREGVGCAMCGNPLGTLYSPCKTAMDGVFSSRPARQPQSQPQPQSSSSKLHVYSFFSSAVSPYPPYKFPSSSPPAPASSSRRHHPSNPNSNGPPWPTRYRISVANPNPNPNPNPGASHLSYPHPNSIQTQSSYPYTSNPYVYPYGYPYPYPYSYPGSGSGSETSLVSSDNEDDDIGDEEMDNEEGVVVHGYDVPIGLVGGVRAPRMRRTYSGLNPSFLADVRLNDGGLESEGAQRFFFGRYFSSSPVPFEEENREGGANENGEGEGEGNNDEGVREEQERLGVSPENPSAEDPDTVQAISSTDPESPYSRRSQPGSEPIAEAGEQHNEEEEEENIHVSSSPVSPVQPMGFGSARSSR